MEPAKKKKQFPISARTKKNKNKKTINKNVNKIYFLCVQNRKSGKIRVFAILDFNWQFVVFDHRQVFITTTYGFFFPHFISPSVSSVYSYVFVCLSLTLSLCLWLSPTVYSYLRGRRGDFLLLPPLNLCPTNLVSQQKLAFVY